MSTNVKDNVNRIFGLTGSDDNSGETREKVQKMYGVKENTYNPFLDKHGNVFNKYIDYQKVLDNPNVKGKAKDFITQATGLTPTKTEPEVTSANNSESYESHTKSSGINSTGQSSTGNSKRVGFISAKYESGGNGGTISQDTGGLSYGISQFNTGSGSADNFVSWLKQTSPDMASAFGSYMAGTNEFSNAWTSVYSQYGEDFTDIQRQYTYEHFAMPLAELAKEKTGIDYTRSDALRELIYSTAVQFGSGSLGLSALGNVTADMSDTDIINASYDKKISNYKNFFSSSTPEVQESVKNRFVSERDDVLALVGNSSTVSTAAGSTAGSYTSSIGKRVANTANYNNNAAKGQCVWYVRGRAAEKLGKDTGAIGNANEMWYNAKAEAKLSAKAENIKPNIIVSYQTGTSSGGAKYGHVIYIEDVVGDTVYYTEGGSSYYNSGTDGVIKTATREGILNGVNTNGSRMGSGVIGFIDLSKY